MTRRLFDAHFHIIDPRFPLLPNNGYLPEAFSCDDYRSRMKGYELSGGAVVSGSFQGYDQSYLLAALGELGPGFVGVTQVPATVTDEEVISLDRAGVRGGTLQPETGGIGGERGSGEDGPATARPGSTRRSLCHDSSPAIRS